MAMPYDPNIHHRRSIRLPGYDYAQPGAYFVTICTHERECVLGDVVNGRAELNDLGHLVARFWSQVPVRFPSVIIDSCVTMPNHGHAIIVITEPGRGVVATPSTAPGATPDPPRDALGAGRGRETQPLRNPADPGAAIRRGVVATPSATPGATRDAVDMGRGGETPPLQNPANRSAATRRGVVATPTATPNPARYRADPRQGGETPPLRPLTLGQIVAFYKYQTTKTINQMRDRIGIRFWQRNYWEHVIRNEAEMQRIREYIHTNPARWSDDQLHPDARANRFNQD
jgi:REP-associated tyrosine transposase